MNMQRSIRKFPFLFTIVINICLLFSVSFLMRKVQNLLDSDVQINLTEVVTQNKNVITSRLTLEMNNLSIISRQLSDRVPENPKDYPAALKETFLSYHPETQGEEVFIADQEGTAIFSDGAEIDISGRNYFRLGMQGINNISERTVSRRNGEDIFVICTPILCKGSIVGTVQKQYTSQEIYDLCSISLFSEKGNMKIINNQGYILIDSDQDGYIKESDNYFRQLYLDMPDASRLLEDDIKNKRSGFFETTVDGVRYFSAYTPIDDVYDWYLITSVAKDAVSPNATIVIKLFYFILSAVVVVFGISVFYILILKNRQESRVRKVAFVDNVTDGNTFAKLQYDFETAFRFRPGDHTALLAFDIDNFKYINSLYGFDAGDQILKEIYQKYASRLNSHELIARVYGDHFVAILQDGSARRLEQLFEPELNCGGITVYLSAGLYPVTDLKESINLMIDKASTAKQQTKGIRYKNIQVYTEEMNQQMIQNEQMKRLVEQAISDDEIVPYFQPKVDIETRKLVGAEALARWKKKDGSIVPPGAFIPVCEKTGLITTIDFMIFEKTLQFLQRNLEQGIPCPPISVNFSRVHFFNNGFLETILEKLDAYQVPPELIEVEITETAIYDNYQLMEQFIEKLHFHGLRISMDDFGSGYSSLHMLKDIPIDVIKIDRGFLMETANSTKQKVVFAAIAQMAEGLEMEVVVEGVENQENVDLMKEFGCTIAQGFLFARPMPQDDFENIYKGGYV